MKHRKQIFKLAKQTIAMVLALAMVLELIPQSVYAESSSNIQLEKTYESENCEITYKESSSWGNFVNSEVSIKNKSNKDKALWQLEIEFNGNIQNIWNADIISADSNLYVIAPKTYNSTIGAGQTVSFGFLAYGENSKPEMPKTMKLKNDKKDSVKQDNSKITISGQEYALPEEWNGLNYALFTSGSGDLSLYTSTTNIKGSVHTNENFYYQGNTVKIDGVLESSKGINISTSDGKNAIDIAGKTENSDVLKMPDILKELKTYVKKEGKEYKEDKTFGANTIAVDQSLYINGLANFDTTQFVGNGIILSKDSMSYNVGELSTPSGSKLFLASEQGDVSLNGTSICMNAVIYAPNGCVNINCNELNLNGRIIAKKICFNGTILNINSDGNDLEPIQFLFKPEIDLDIDGNFKENRKIEMSVKEIANTEYVKKEETVWEILKNGEPAEKSYAIDKENSDCYHKEMIFKEAGEYRINVTVTTGKVSYTVSKEISIEKDLAPVAIFSFESNYYKRNKDGVAKIEIEDLSSSIDNDVLGKRIWTVFYDKNNDGKYTDDEAEVFDKSKKSALEYTTKKVGKYKIQLDVEETFEDTIPKLLDKDAFRSANTRNLHEAYCEFEVGNSAPVAKVDVQKSKSVDIVFTIGDTTKEKLETYTKKIDELKEQLLAHNIDANIDSVSTSTYTAQDSFAWKEYSHYKCDGYDNHIDYDEKNIRMNGYYYTAYKDFLYIPNESSGTKTFEFDLQRDRSDWHSMEGGGFLFNTTVSDENNSIKGFCILVTQSGLKLDQIDCSSLNSFRNGSYNYVQYAGKLLKTFPLKNLYENHHFKIVVNKQSVSVWDGEEAVVDDFILPENDYGYGFGPIISHASHGCSQRSYFTFQNITMQSMDGSSLSDIVNGYKWRPGASHYVVNLSDKEVPELVDDEATAELAAALIKNSASFVGLGNEQNENQYHKLLCATEVGGMVLDSNSLDKSMDETNAFIENTINAKNYDIDKYITTDDIVTYNGYYEDEENDELYEAKWEYEYDPTVFDEDGNGKHIVKECSEPITVFEDCGAYTIRLKVCDNPGLDNDDLQEYRKWSDTSDYEKLLIVQSRPIAKVDVTLTEDQNDEAICIANTSYQAEDPDHLKQDNKGIREEKFYYKTVGDTSWTEGKLPNKLEIGKTYLVKYLVKDMEGTWSFPDTKVVKTSSMRSYKEVDDQIAPEVFVEVTKTQIELGETIRVDGYATDDWGIDTFSLLIDGEKQLDAFGRVFYTSKKEGDIVVKAIATDLGGNHSEKTLTLNVVDNRDKTPPTIAIVSPKTNSDLSADTEILGTVKDDKALKCYKLTYKKTGEEEEHVINEGTNPIENDVIGKWKLSELDEGTYSVTLYAEDVSGNYAYTGFTISVVKQEEETENDSEENPAEDPSKTDPSSNPGDYAGQGSSSGDASSMGDEATKKELLLTLNRLGMYTDNSVLMQITYPTSAKKDTLQVFAQYENCENKDEVTVKNGIGSFIATKPGTLYFTATVSDKDGKEHTASAKLPVYDKNDKTAPVTNITVPKADAILSKPTDVVGTVKDESNLKSYSLSYQMNGTDTWTTIAEGNESIEDGVLGRLDTTVMPNGAYKLRLLAEDFGGNRRTLTRKIVVEGNLKIGPMHMGFEDLKTSLGGTSIVVNRIYDNRNKSKGDFGYGWTLGLSSVDVYESHSIEDGYEMVKSGSMFSTGYEMKETVSHDVTIAYGDGTSDRFKLTFSPERKALVPISEVKIGYRCVTDPKVKLEIIGDTTAFVSGSELMFYDESMSDSLSYKLTTKDGNILYINHKGVYKIIDASGNVIKVDASGYHGEDGKSVLLTRDKQGRIEKITNTNGSVILYEYDDNGDLVSVTDSANRTVRYEYDNQHNLMSIIDPLGVAVSRNEYDDEGRLVATIDAEGHRIEYQYDVEGRTQTVKDKRGNVTVYTYDDNGNILEIIDAYGNKVKNTFDSNNNLLSTKDQNGNVTSYAYDDSGNVTEVRAADGSKVSSTYTQENRVSSISMLDKQVMAMSYDSKGRLSTMEDANGNETTYSYTKDGRLSGLSDEIGEIQTITYDADGNPVTSTNGAGESAAYTYDDNGNCESVTISRIEDGKQVSFTSRYVYDAANNLVQSIDNAGNVTTFEYDANGNQTAAVSANKERITYTYDDAGNTTKVTYPDGTFEAYTYDANGNNVTATSRSGVSVKMTYDKLNRMTKKEYPDGTKEMYQYDPVGNVLEKVSSSGAKTTYTYDNRNRNTTVTDALGNVTTFTYDKMSRLTSRKDALDNETTYAYDDNGNVVKTTYADNTYVTARYDARNRVVSQKDAYGNETKYDYDGADRLTKVTDAYGHSYSYTYDGNGNLSTVSDANEQVTTYQYDAVGRVSQVKNALGKTMEYDYDSVGNMVRYKDYAGTVTKFTYGKSNQLLKKSVGDKDTTYIYSKTGLLTKVTDESGSITYDYDAYNRLSMKTDTKGNKLTYTYDEAGRIKTFDNGFGKTSYEYDVLDRITRVVDRNGKATVYEYDAVGNRSAVRYANGVVMTYTYDACQRLKEECINNASGKLLTKYRYGLGKAGERLSITEVDEDGEETLTAYSYDKLQRLTKEEITRDNNKLTNEYTYDNVSNRIAKETTVKGDVTAIANTDLEEVDIKVDKTTYTYNALNQLLTESNAGKTITYTYDANGNLIKQSGDKEVDYTYDQENHLLKATIQKGNSVTIESYTYDYEGNRTSKTVNEEDTTWYILDTSTDLSQVVAKTDDKGTETASYTLGEERITVEQAGKTWYYLYDGHGNVRSLSDEQGKLTDRYDYDAYGNLLEKAGKTDNDFLYTGEQYNAGTGLYYLRARYMNPATGTFISMDSYQGSMYDPVSLHKYLYANADPVKYVDPSGYTSVSEFSVASAMQSALNGIKNLNCLNRLVQWANAVCTIYDTATEMMNVIFNDGSVVDLFVALLKGVVVGFMCDGMCKAGLGFILKPVMAVFGVNTQVNELQEAIHEGDPTKIAVKTVELICMIFGLTRQCFTGDTLVSTEDGLRPIAEIAVGDYVWSENTETGEKELKKVLAVSVTESKALVHVTLSDGTKIDTTENHPFFTEDKGWCAAGELETGDVLRSEDGKNVVVESVTVEQLTTPVKVYNLEIEDNHTYYVSSAEVLVHNMCKVGKDGVPSKSGRTSTTGENSRILSDNLAREGRAVGEGEAAAHIVASTGTKRQWASAADSRALLTRYDIDINDAANGIPLGHPRPHNLTHNRAFHEMVNARLHTVETNMLNNGYGKRAIRSALRRELRSIGKEFENGIRN